MIDILAYMATAASVSLYAGPRPEQTETFRDWITGCDNERNCSAVALAPPTASAEAETSLLQIQIDQRHEHHLDPVVSIRLAEGVAISGGLHLRVDNAQVESLQLVNRLARIDGARASALVRRMRLGKAMALHDASGTVVSRASLSGLTAALLRIDEQQGKAGTPRGLAQPGRRRPFDDAAGYSVSLSRSARSERPPSAPDAQAMAQLRANEQCKLESDKPAAPFMIRLDSDATMMIVPWRCGNGAYNLYSNIMIINGFGEMRPAAFDYDNGITGDGPSNVQVNVSWDDQKRELVSFSRTRGIGDCGRVDHYIWGGEKFMLSEQWAMPECRMAFGRIRTWKVDVTDR